MLTIGRSVAIDDSEFEWSFARSSGAGGQNVNKVNSKAVLRWNPAQSSSLAADVKERFVARYASRLTTAGDLVLASDAYRDQGRNVAHCLEKLESMLEAVAVPPKKRRPTKPSRSKVAARLRSKKQHSDKKSSRRRSGWDGD